MKKTLMALGAAAALTISAVSIPAPAQAQRGVAAGPLAWPGAAAKNDAATNPATTKLAAILFTTNHLLVARKHGKDNQSTG